MSTNTTHTRCAIQTLTNANDVTKTAGLRALANNALFRAIGLIDIAIRGRRRREEMHASESGERTAEQRHSIDQDERISRDPEVHLMGDEPMKDVVGASAMRRDPTHEASQLFAVYEYARQELMGVGAAWEQAMAPEDAVAFRAKAGMQDDSAIVAAISAMTGIDAKVLKTWNELAFTQEQAEFTRNAPEILSTLKSWEGVTLNDEAFVALDPVTQHQMAVKVAGKLKERKEKVIIRAMRTRRISELGDLALLDDGIEQFKALVKTLERENSAALQAAVENGRSLVSIEDALR